MTDNTYLIVALVCILNFLFGFEFADFLRRSEQKQKDVVGRNKKGRRRPEG